jgi:hypothetical protein
MSRILARLAAINLFSLSVVFVLGAVSALRGATLIDDLNYPLHLYLGLFAIFFNLGLHCLIFIYFLGTGRWVKEVALAYGLPDAPLPRLTRDLKRRTFPPALFAMLVPIAAAATGMGHYRLAWPWAWHLALGIASILVNVWALRIEARDVAINAGIITEVLQEVDRIRVAQGLPTNAEALEQERR